MPCFVIVVVVFFSFFLARFTVSPTFLLYIYILTAVSVSYLSVRPLFGCDCWLTGCLGWGGAGAIRLAIRVRREASEGPGRLPDLHGRLGEGDGRAAPPDEDLLPEAEAVDVHHVRTREY